MLPGAAAASKPKPLVQPARPVEPPPVVATPIPVPPPATPAPSPVAPPPVVPAQPAAAKPTAPAQPPAQRPGRAQPAARQPAVPPPAAVVAATTAAAASPPAVPPDQPAARRPEAVKPGPERPRPTQRPGPQDTPAPNPGDLVCGNCGIGNDPARKFCRRCGQSLATATVAPAPKIPWYRRMFGGGQPKKVKAGERPKSMRTDGRTGDGIRPGRVLSAGVQILMLAAIVGAVVGYAIVPAWRDTVNGIIGSITGTFLPAADPVSTAGKATGTSTKDHPPQLAFDGRTSYWAAPFQDGAPPTIQAAFTPVADISKVLFTAGAPGKDFKVLARPRDVTLEFLDAGGTVIASKSYELKDQVEPQSFDVGAKAAATVRLTVRSVYLSETAKAPVAITEVEFFGKRQGAASPSAAP